MIAVAVCVALLIGLALGAQLPRRRRFNAGVAAGRRAERLEHGWRDDPALSHVPRQRRWRHLDRKHVPGPAPRVLDHMPRHH